jgi:signal transduction histidine kinase
LFLGAAAWAFSRPSLWVGAAATAVVGLIGLVQRVRSRPRPGMLLVAMVTLFAVTVPMSDPAADVVTVPLLVLSGSIGSLVLSRRPAMIFATWCWLLCTATLPWILVDSRPAEMLIASVLLAAVQFAGWWFVSLAADLLQREEQSHRVALEANKRLLEFEHALARCSRALLIGSGEEALEDALATLREAIGADRAYLALNVEDAELGPSFLVVNSTTRPGGEEDDWVGEPRPWSKYPDAADLLAAGRPYRHVATEEPGKGWNRSVLSVPVFIEGRWVASAGFVDIARKTVWDEEAIWMLQVAAPMLGTFWERETTRRRLEELIESKDRFVASVSHELRTPLSAVLGFAEELRSNAGSFRGDELTGMLELIADQSQEMADMVEDLLVSARADIGKISIDPQDVFLRAQAETVLASLGSTGDKSIHVMGGRGKVWADPSRTRQIIRNLLTNAIRYGGEQVTVEAVEGERSTVLTVSDDGPGIDPAQWDSIFEPYHRAHEATTQPASIGLGLTVSRQLARLMGGDLVYEHGEDGSAFYLTLPAADPSAAALQDGAMETPAMVATTG